MDDNSLLIDGTNIYDHVRPTDIFRVFTLHKDIGYMLSPNHCFICGDTFRSAPDTYAKTLISSMIEVELSNKHDIELTPNQPIFMVI
jgi:hypothetical protein